MIRAAENDDIYVFQARASDPPPKAWRDKTKSEEARDTSQNNSRGLGADRVWLIGDAIHPMLPARGMGGNQAMNDTVDALTSILELNTASKTRALTENDFASAVKQYEDKMLPRAFKWVAASGGTGTKVCPRCFMNLGELASNDYICYSFSSRIVTLAALHYLPWLEFLIWHISSH
jgi:2-polyprenyl-6-methoxyphenol hydroxylase-like FAD-dependent oxidoreductase